MLRVALLAAAVAVAAMTADAGSDVGLTDFSRLTLPTSPNRWLIAPAGLFSATPDEVAPTFPVAAERVAAAWIAVVRDQPRTRIIAVSADGLQIEAEQKTAVFGFVDRISFRAIPLTPASATLAAYSRAETGYWDLGVNRRRLRAWLAELTARLDPGLSPSSPR